MSEQPRKQLPLPLTLRRDQKVITFQFEDEPQQQAQVDPAKQAHEELDRIIKTMLPYWQTKIDPVRLVIVNEVELLALEKIRQDINKQNKKFVHRMSLSKLT